MPANALPESAGNATPSTLHGACSEIRRSSRFFLLCSLHLHFDFSFLLRFVFLLDLENETFAYFQHYLVPSVTLYTTPKVYVTDCSIQVFISQVPSKVPGPRLLRFLTFFHDFCAIEKHDFASTSQVFTLLLIFIRHSLESLRFSSTSPARIRPVTC
jgi:hypothetical protein